MHRFYSGKAKDAYGELSLEQKMWINHQEIVKQLLVVLRMGKGSEFVLFDGKGKEVLYRIVETEKSAVCVEKITDMFPKYPDRSVTLAWSLLKKDKNDWVLQKCTELGVSHFVPLISDRTEKTGFSSERAEKIIIEATEQCGRHDIPTVQEPLPMRDYISQHPQKERLYVTDLDTSSQSLTDTNPAILVVGPEGGWSTSEREFFDDHALNKLHLGSFTLRAETACIVAVQKLL